MKQLKTTLVSFLLASMALILSNQPGIAQNDSRMQQDLRISRGILTELIKSDNPESNSRIKHFNSEAKSAYIPGYGVIFELSSGIYLPSVANIQTIDVRGTDDGDKEVHMTLKNTENERIREASYPLENEKNSVYDYFKNYADLLGKLDPNEKVTVIVRSGGGFLFFAPPPPPTPPNPNGTARVSTVQGWSSNQSSGFIMSAKRSDINAFKSGNISEVQFKSRIVTKELTQESPTELRIFERILETGLSTDSNSTFSLSRGMTSILDENSGLLILGSIRGGSSGSVFFKEVELDSLREVTIVRDRDSLRASSVVFRGNAVTLNGSLDTLTVNLRRANEQLERSRAELARARELQVFSVDGNFEYLSGGDSPPKRSAEEIQSDLEAFVESAKNILLDYGRNLQAIKSGQSIMLLMDLRTPGDSLPSKVIISVNKDVIENYDKRSISKEAAKAQISVVKQ